MKFMRTFFRIIILDIKPIFILTLCIAFAISLLLCIANAHTIHSLEEQVLWAIGGFTVSSGIQSVNLLELSRWLLITAPILAFNAAIINTQHKIIVPIILRIQSYRLLWYKLCAIVFISSLSYSIFLPICVTVCTLFLHAQIATTLPWDIYLLFFIIFGCHSIFLNLILLVFENRFKNQGILLCLILLFEGTTATIDQITSFGAWNIGTWGMIYKFMEGGLARNCIIIVFQLFLTLLIVFSTSFSKTITRIL